VSFGDVLISFEIEISVSKDDDSQQPMHHWSVIVSILQQIYPSVDDCYLGLQFN